MTKEQYVSRVLKKYNYLDIDEVEDIFETAKRELFITLYSCNASVVDENTPIPYIYEMKVLDCMLEIIDLGTARNFTTYQENGISWNRPTNGYKSYENILSKAVIY